MTRPAWQDLLRCYDNVEFLDGGRGILTIVDGEILNAVRAIDADDVAANDLNLYPTEDVARTAIGDKIEVHVGAPKLSLGILAWNLDDLLFAPRGFVEFPQRFYVVENRLSDRDTSPPLLRSYRAVVSLVQILTEAAAFLDRDEQRLFYFKDGKIEVPVRYTAAIFKAVDTGSVERLIGQFEDQLHRAQKLTILGDTIAALARSQPEAVRFDHLVRNVDQMVTSLDDGYRLFVSSFSYDKIRTDIETSNLDFLTRIHKTFVDIQGQLLGIPIATIVVASQLKSATTCGVEAWTNFAILVGAWIFVVFLSVSIVNQFFTLSAIASEVARQRGRLESDFAAVSAKFVGTFASLVHRICWYRLVFVVIGALGIGGAAFATFAFRSLTAVKLAGCLW
ncbi:hypothetical protein [Bradyrhizobium sp. S3.2.12]|uniref:hypothetical protein n=1 Tax=Bradyrhizobium sp. S3.2.12 TaxID=3156387 RepID=UPI0033997DCC